MTADPNAAAKLGRAHVVMLRRAVKAGRLTRGVLDLLGDDANSLVRDLDAAGLMTWDGGARATPGTGEAYGTWAAVETGAVVVTTEGLAFLRGYELGCQRRQSELMTAGPSKPRGRG